MRCLLGITPFVQCARQPPRGSPHQVLMLLGNPVPIALQHVSARVVAHFARVVVDAECGGIPFWR